MSQHSHSNGQQFLTHVRQQSFLGDEAEVSANGNGAASAKPRKRRSQKQSSTDASDVATLAVAEILHDELGKLGEKLQRIESLLAELHERVVQGSIVKEYYTTQDVAKILNKRPYTVREWCRLGRVHGEKSHAGRGLDEEWRICHAELTRIQNEGLLPLLKNSKVERPRRME
jgi:hypothetical protein